MTVKTNPEEITENLRALFKDHFQKEVQEITPLPVSGSDRRYYRMTAENISVIGSYNQNVSENNSYFYFTDLLTKHGINIPEIFAKSKDKRYYLQQDLGNKSLFAQLLEEGYTDAIKEQYHLAIDELVKFQWLAGTEANYEQCFATKRFDEKAIMADLLYFKYYFADLHKIHHDKLAVLEEMEQWSKDLGRIQPQTLMFRDFQSRNIMLHDDKIYLIDYQGSMQGPPQYDIASLLWQAKAQLPNERKEELLRYYIAKLQEYPVARMEEINFRKGYLQFVLLRLLQVLGAYGYRGLLEKKPHFISSIYPALKHLEQFLSDNPQMPAYPAFRKLLEEISSKKIIALYQPVKKKKNNKLTIHISSFSYKKNGIPKDKTEHGGGYVFDCRSLLNPGRFEAYKYATGKDVNVQNFLKEHTTMPSFLENVIALVTHSVDVYLERDFDYLSIAFGCTGGQHRSVYAAEQLAKFLEEKYKLPVTVQHCNEKNWVKEK